jgi:hypothetical protein
MLDNVDVAVFTKVNELAQRYGLKPYDFVATFQLEEDTNGTRHVLSFESPAHGNALREERFDMMLNALGITPSDERGAVLKGSVAKIMNALDDALEHAPRSRKRF